MPPGVHSAWLTVMTEEEKNGKCPTPYGKTLDGHIIACKRWSCPHCSNVKIMRISNKTNYGFKDREILYRVTITQRLGSTRNIMRDWQTLKKRIERKYSAKVNYFWVKEKTKNGQRHLHLLIDQAVDSQWIRDNYAEITRGESFHVKVNEEPVLHCWGYALKYMSKDLDIQLVEIDGKKVPYWNYKERKYGYSRELFKGLSGNQEWFTEYSRGASNG